MSDFEILWRQIILGIGIGLFNPANNSAIIGSLPREKMGLASSFLALSRNLGMVIGVAFAEMVITFGLPISPLERAKAPIFGEHSGCLETGRHPWAGGDPRLLDKGEKVEQTRRLCWGMNRLPSPLEGEG